MRYFSDAREHQQLRRIESPAAKDDLAAVLLRKVTPALAGRRFLHRARLVKVIPDRALHADGARRILVFPLLEEHARHLRARLDDKPVRILKSRVQQELAHAETPPFGRLASIRPCRAAFDPEWNKKDALGIGAAGVDIVEVDRLHHAGLHKLPFEKGDQRVVAMQHAERGAGDGLDERAVLLRNRGDEKWVDEIGRRPSLKPVSAFVEHGARIEQQHQPAVGLVKDPEQIAEEAVVGVEILIAFQLREVTAHRPRAPRWVASKVRDVVPVLVVRTNRDHRVMRRASANAGAARVKDALLATAWMWVAELSGQRPPGVWVDALVVFFVLGLPPVIRMMPHGKHPAHLRIFRGRGVIAGHLGYFPRPGIWPGL